MHILTKYLLFVHNYLNLVLLVWPIIKENKKCRAGVAEWFTAPCLLCAAWMVMGLSPKPPPMLADTSAGTWIEKARLTSIQSAGVTPEVNLRNSLHAGDKARKWGIHSGFETQGRHHQNSKTGVSVAPWKGLMSSKIFKKRKRRIKMV